MLQRPLSGFVFGVLARISMNEHMAGDGTICVGAMRNASSLWPSGSSIASEVSRGVTDVRCGIDDATPS